MSRDKQQRFIARGSLGFLPYYLQRSFIIIIFVLIKRRILIVGDLGCGFFPYRDHTVKGFVFGDGFVFVLAALLQMPVLAEHFNRVADIIAVLFYKTADTVFVKIITELFVLGIFLYCKPYNRTGSILHARIYRISVCTARFPAVCLSGSVGFAFDGDFIRDHKSRVESHSELTDNVYFILNFVFGIVFEVE